jgi:hypothetical protein
MILVGTAVCTAVRAVQYTATVRYLGTFIQLYGRSMYTIDSTAVSGYVSILLNLVPESSGAGRTLRSSGTSRRRCARWSTQSTACRKPAPPCRAHLRSQLPSMWSRPTAYTNIEV